MAQGLERSRRWPPRQRIQLNAAGRTATEAYVQLVAEARSANRSTNELQTALNDWAGKLGVRPSDGVLLEELLAGLKTVSELARSVEATGQNATEVKAGVDRLYGAELVEPPAPENATQPNNTPQRHY